jgi:hypothetical protein
MVALVACLAQLGNVINWPFSAGPLPFLLALIAGLIGSGAIFVYLVLIRPDREEVIATRVTVASEISRSTL